MGVGRVESRGVDGTAHEGRETWGSQEGGCGSWGGRWARRADSGNCLVAKGDGRKLNGCRAIIKRACLFGAGEWILWCSIVLRDWHMWDDK
jgi:hypothetical protein